MAIFPNLCVPDERDLSTGSGSSQNQALTGDYRRVGAAALTNTALFLTLTNPLIPDGNLRSSNSHHKKMWVSSSIAMIPRLLIHFQAMAQKMNRSLPPLQSRQCVLSGETVELI